MEIKHSSFFHFPRFTETPSICSNVSPTFESRAWEPSLLQTKCVQTGNQLTGETPKR